MTPPHSISTDQAMFYRPWIIASIRSSYWGQWQSVAKIDAAINNSLCFGLYVDEGGPYQIGFARVLTDRSVLSALTDVVIRDGYRSKGYGTALVRAVLDHQDVRDTLCILDCRPENEAFYARLGFERKRNVMQAAPR